MNENYFNTLEKIKQRVPQKKKTQRKSNENRLIGQSEQLKSYIPEKFRFQTPKKLHKNQSEIREQQSGGRHSYFNFAKLFCLEVTRNLPK